MDIIKKKFKLKWDWQSLVLLSTLLLALIMLFKIVFWLSVMAVICGIIWIFLNISNEDHSYTWIALILIVGGLLLGSISYQIGYEFEQSKLGKPIVDTAKSVVDTNDKFERATMNMVEDAVNGTSDIVNGKR